MLIEVGLSCVWHLLSCALNSCPWAPWAPQEFCSLYCLNYQDIVTVKLLLVWLGAFCTLVIVVSEVWGSVETLSLLCILGFILLSCWEGSFPVSSFMVSYGLHLLKTVQQIFSQLCWVLYWTCLHVVYNELFKTTICFINWIVEKFDISILRLST